MRPKAGFQIAPHRPKIGKMAMTSQFTGILVDFFDVSVFSFQI